MQALSLCRLRLMCLKVPCPDRSLFLKQLHRPSWIPLISMAYFLTILSLSLRRSSHSNAGNPPSQYRVEHDIAHFVSYSDVAHIRKAFIASLDMASIPIVGGQLKKTQSGGRPCQRNLEPSTKMIHGSLCYYHLDKWVNHSKVKKNRKGKLDRYKA